MYIYYNSNQTHLLYNTEYRNYAYQVFDFNYACKVMGGKLKV